MPSALMNKFWHFRILFFQLRQDMMVQRSSFSGWKYKNHNLFT